MRSVPCALLLVLAACGGGSTPPLDADAPSTDAPSTDAPSTDSGTDAATARDSAGHDALDPHDAAPCRPTGCPGFRCGPSGVPQSWDLTCGTCTYRDLPTLCDVCRPGTAGDLADVVCPAPVARGAPCTSDDDCIPAAADLDAYGLAHDVALACDASSHCSAPPWIDEVCGNARDDDDDGTVDEACACVPRTFDVSPLASPRTGLVTGAIGGHHVLVVGPTSGSVTEPPGPSRATWIDPEGVVLRDGPADPARPDLFAAASVAQVDSALAFVLVRLDYRAVPAIVERVVRILDDGTEEVLERPLSENMSFQTFDAGGGDVGVLWRASGSSAVTRVVYGGAPLARRSETTLLFPSSTLALAPLDGGEHLAAVWTYDHTQLLVAGASSTLRELGPLPAGLSGQPQDIVRTRDRLWILQRDAAATPILIALDPATGEYVESVRIEGTLPDVDDPFGPRPHPPSPRLVAHGEVLFLAWAAPSSTLHVLAVTTAGQRLGYAALPLAPSLGDGPDEHRMILGVTDGGVRIVHRGDAWNLAAPCDAL